MEEVINKYQSQKEDPDPTSDPISQHLLPILKAWWWEIPDKDKAKEILDILPETCKCRHTKTSTGQQRNLQEKWDKQAVMLTNL